MSDQSEQAEQTNIVNSIWNQSLGKLKGELSEQSFATWFEPLVCLELTPEFVRLGVADQFSIDWLKDHYLGLISSDNPHERYLSYFIPII